MIRIRDLGINSIPVVRLPQIGPGFEIAGTPAEIQFAEDNSQCVECDPGGGSTCEQGCDDSGCDPAASMPEDAERQASAFTPDAIAQIRQHLLAEMGKELVH